MSSLKNQSHVCYHHVLIVPHQLLADVSQLGLVDNFLLPMKGTLRTRGPYWQLFMSEISLK